MDATVADVIALLDERYPPVLAESWDRIGLVVGDPIQPVRSVLFVVDCVPETVAEAVALDVDLIVAHHPLLLRGVHSVAMDTYKGRAITGLIKNDIALYAAHTNADHASPGVSDALAARLRLADVRPLVETGAGRIGRLATPMTLAAFVEFAAAALPATAAGIRAAGEPGRLVHRVAVCGGAGDAFLADARAAGVDAYLTADLRHHPAGEHLAGGGPALVDAAHWATERPWLDDVSVIVRERLGVDVHVSDLDTDPWTLHVPSRG